MTASMRRPRRRAPLSVRSLLLVAAAVALLVAVSGQEAASTTARTWLGGEMNGVPLPVPHGSPVRLIAPGWYGVVNVKWLKRIEVRDTRFMGRFMARDYVTIREEPSGAGYVETSVGRARLKSAPAKVTRKGGDYRIYGAAWGRPIAKVEVRIDDGPWREATIDQTNNAPYAWKIWTLDWPNPSPGEHRITSRATDTQGNVQPAMTDPVMANKRTYWETFGQASRTVRVA